MADELTTQLRRLVAAATSPVRPAAPSVGGITPPPAGDEVDPLDDIPTMILDHPTRGLHFSADGVVHFRL